ncbi:MAG TPA: alpha/beta hydrolase [Solirubrobacteraceae bacterium]|jgi:pimeloyl-ACP methyl ester carboxylesterase
MAAEEIAASGSEGSIRCPDGRRLSFREYGAHDGQPVFYFHGWPGSSLEFAPNNGAAAAAGVRVIAVDRPGIGGSDRQRRRRVLDWPADVSALADALGLDRFAVLGFSFGGPYARACAYAMPERVRVAALVSSSGPLDDPDAGERLMQRPLRLMIVLARRSPTLALPFAWLNAREARAGGSEHTHAPPSADAELLDHAAIAQGLAASAADCFRAGLRGAVEDATAVARRDGFGLEEITSPVQIWHGELDDGEPVAMARSQARRIPKARARYVKDGGHLILFSHASEILAGLRVTS